jgi:hypothetical protein
MGDGVKKKLLMFSDIEGCQASPDKNLEQSKFLCSESFYDKLGKMLDPEKGGDSNLHIAFLGDYFDQGMGVYESITGMMSLLDNPKFDGRVYVILGNRDVNKLRFCFELAKKGIVGLEKGKRWEAGFGSFYDNLDDKTDVALANCILFHSMGAKLDMTTNMQNRASDAKLIGLHSFLPSSLSAEQKKDSQLALKYLKASLGIIPKDDIDPKPLDLLGFFQKCKLAHVFDGTHGKVLLAHGGGFDPEAFFDQAYVDSFGQGMNEIAPDNYHTTLEAFRRRLSGIEPVQNRGYGYNREIANAYGKKVSLENMSGIDRTQAKVALSVEAYNKLLKDVLNELRQSPPKFTWRFVLLQALGLKPDNEDARYKSLIQSCSQDGCSGPNDPLTTDPIDKKTNRTKLAKILKDSGITHVSYGHKPICFPIPVIYRRKEIPDVTFISNDTSNANRKVEEIGNNTAIGTMVIFDPEGVQSKIEPIELGAREGKVDNYKEMYEPLTFETTPVYKQQDGANFLKYGTKKVVFNNLLKKAPPEIAYGQLKFEDMPPEVAAASGGRRRSRNRKRNTKKRSSKRVSKQTRRNKHHTKHSRKMRKQ